MRSWRQRESCVLMSNDDWESRAGALAAALDAAAAELRTLVADIRKDSLDEEEREEDERPES